MIATKENPRWEELLSGQFAHQFQLASAAMIVSRCQRQVMREPQTLQKNIDELHAFFTKFENVVSDDLKAIFS
jgi:deoxyribodipyrimidine photolyase